jgi:hypothetical protein
MPTISGLLSRFLVYGPSKSPATPQTPATVVTNAVSTVSDLIQLFPVSAIYAILGSFCYPPVVFTVLF